MSTEEANVNALRYLITLTKNILSTTPALITDPGACRLPSQTLFTPLDAASAHSAPTRLRIAAINSMRRNKGGGGVNRKIDKEEKRGGPKAKERGKKQKRGEDSERRNIRGGGVNPPKKHLSFQPPLPPEKKILSSLPPAKA